MTEKASPTYPRVTSAAHGKVQNSVRFPEIEERILKYWETDDTFKASVESRPEDDEFVFYDGPPFANGLPHYGHLLTGYVKDLVPRYQTMRGKRVERRFGWDTHGLPAELSAMKDLGMTDKAEIEAMGIEHFNDACRSNVLKFTKEWSAYVNRQARWVDFENDYKTLNVEFMESVIWAFKQLHEKGLTYQGFRVLPYCWKDETPLSNHELRMDDEVYKDRQDPSVTVTFPITGGGALGDQLRGVNLLAWTTTPWTLPTNFSVAVGPDIEYAVVEAPADGPLPGRHMIAADLVGAYAQDIGFTDQNEVSAAEAAQAAVVGRYVGKDLAQLEYEPLWHYYADTAAWGTQNAWRVLIEDYITTTDGTGIVHQASAYGEEDQRSSEEAGIPVILSVDAAAQFLPMFAEPTPHGDTPLAEIAGVQVFEANRPIINRLKADGRLVREQSYVHSYPHCWRCRTPLMYKAVTSWYVAVTEIKARMLELNEQINWIPDNVKYGQFGKWLENARDWSISRNRYWGSPIPVWASDDPNYPRTEVYGSLDELKEAFGDYPRNAAGEPDLHRPWIDQLTRPNPDDPTGKSTMRRVEDVLDVWFDSGSMPFAQVHYPFENASWFDSHNPADFIVEYIGQTRGWFYTMHILATALFDRPGFSNVISHGIVLGSDGQKMSKSLQNYPDVNEVFNRDGSDAMRWFLMSSPILRGGNLVVTEEGIREGVRQVLLPMWNAWHFFALYANSANAGTGYQARPVENDDAQLTPLDHYILAATGDLVRDATEALDDFDVSRACDALRRFADLLTNWYIRRSRQRFYDEDFTAYDVLYTVLETFTRVAAPLLPLVTEEVWRGLTGGRSVHLADWPDPARYVRDERAVELMDLTRVVTSAGSALRKQAKRRVRQPLATLTVVVPGAQSLAGTYEQIIADELNIKQVELRDTQEVSAEQYGIGQQLVVNARVAGPRLGKEVQHAIRGAKSGDWSVSDGAVTAGGLELKEGEYTLTTTVSEELGDKAVTVLEKALGAGQGFLVLDTRLTAELMAEGTARDVIRTIQAARKDEDLQVSDRISTTLTASPAVVDAVEAHAELVKTETLTVELNLVAGEETESTRASVVAIEGSHA
ncbi:isoleucine--tRNA ligase [Nesterenkonia haasae]|uniref:isoleucine--tRNA ligase n=1 Tax=Nesterenkonia haasae TaxID=2587813 RepID=UPI00139182F3|nr:isoleucine--tRNA ligase [Nesterenkonia haasae]NDK30752.1 isoleucine--tRNA ligase [Nesterenkonia haasae]